MADFLPSFNLSFHSFVSLAFQKTLISHNWLCQFLWFLYVLLEFFSFQLSLVFTCSFVWDRVLLYKSRWLKTFCVDQGIFNLCEILLLLPPESCGYVCGTTWNSTLFTLFLIYFDSFSKNFVQHVLIIFILLSTTLPQSILISTKLCIFSFVCFWKVFCVIFV